MLPHKKKIERLSPDRKEADLAAESSHTLTTLIESAKKSSAIKIKMVVNGKEKTLNIPMAAVNLLADILKQMSVGNAITLTSIQAELTTQAAADLLNVSRPYLVKLLEEKKIPCRKVGVRRKILAHDIIAYKKNIDKQRMKTLDNLTKLSQELDLYE